MNDKDPLAPEFKVACTIYHLTRNGGCAYNTKIYEYLKGEVSKERIDECINTLFDWSIITASYGERDNGTKGRLYEISNPHVPLIKLLYDRYISKEPRYPPCGYLYKQIRVLTKKSEYVCMMIDGYRECPNDVWCPVRDRGK